MEKEIWKEYKNTGYYVSDLGRIKGIKNGSILKPFTSHGGYLVVYIRMNSHSFPYKIHRLVWATFKGDFNSLVVDHKDNDRINNRLDNLQLLPERENNAKRKYPYLKTSKYIGVHFKKDKNKWQAQISIKGNRKHLGTFLNEEDAINAYRKALELSCSKAQIYKIL